MMMSADLSTLEAMLRQEKRYFQSCSKHAPTTAKLIKQAVAGLENILDLCQIKDRETLVMATTYLDRYLMCHPPQTSSTGIHRVALICFYMAVKIHQTAALPIKSLDDLYQRFLSTTTEAKDCLLYTSPSPRDQRGSRMPSSA